MCATWNVNGKPPLAPLEEWLISPAVGEEVDIYLIGFQEVQDLKLQGALLTDEDKGRVWALAALRAVGAEPGARGAPYRCVAARQMVGLSLVVIARSGLEVEEVAVAEAGTGFMNQGGNKGGVAARFCVGGLSYCCICSHLAASSDNVERRNQARPGEGRERRARANTSEGEGRRTRTGGGRRRRGAGRAGE
jgi:phosphatidylinositol-bisphosphatase